MVRSLRIPTFSLIVTAFVLAGCTGPSEDPAESSDPSESSAATENTFCRTQHEVEGQTGTVVVCDELYPEAPFVHLPAPPPGKVYAGMDAEGFVTADGTSYPVDDLEVQEAEQRRHSLALYELTVDAGVVTDYRVAVTFPESFFVEPWLGVAAEGNISRLIGEDEFEFDATLPVRVEFHAEPAEDPLAPSEYDVLASIANLEQAVRASDGSCMPALTSHGDEAPFAAGSNVQLRAQRAPSMHAFGDDEFVIFIVVDGQTWGSMMNSQWYRGPLDLVKGTVEPSGTYLGIGHGTPGSLPTLEVKVVEGGGQPCTAY